MGNGTTFRSRLGELRRPRTALPLAILAIVFLALGAAIPSEPLRRFDLRATRTLQATSGPFLDPLMEALTFAGGAVVVTMVAGLVAFLLQKRGRRRAAGYVVASLVSLPFDLVLKALWDRARPGSDVVNVLLPGIGYSFPSGHTTISTAVYGFLAVLAWTELPGRRNRLPLAVGLALMPLLVATSRVYVGAHWLSDVLGGIAAGLLVLTVLATLYRARTKGASSETGARLEGHGSV